MSAKLLKGRYTSTASQDSGFVGEVRYLDPRGGTLYSDEEGKCHANSGFRAVGDGRWVSGTWEFALEVPTADDVDVESTKAILGYVVSSSKGAPTVLHRTQEIAETEALRLAQGNTGTEFTVFPVYCGKAVSKAHTPKPVAKLEKLQ